MHRVGDAWGGCKGAAAQGSGRFRRPSRRHRVVQGWREQGKGIEGKGGIEGRQEECGGEEVALVHGRKQAACRVVQA